MIARTQKTLKSEIDALSYLHTVIGTRAFANAISILAKRKGKIVVTGVGKSSFIGMKLAATLTSLGHYATFLHPIEAMHGDIGVLNEDDVIIAISYSGESPEVLRMVRYATSAFAVSVVAITGKGASSLATDATEKIIYYVENEGCPIGVAPMASTTAALVIGDIIASALTDPAFFTKEHFAKLHPGGALGLSLIPVSKRMTTQTDVPLVEHTAPLIEALEKITTGKRGVVGVTNANGVLMGIITDGDIRRFMLLHHTVVAKSASDAMTKNPKMLTESASLQDALSAMEEHKITSLIIVDAKKYPLGIIHIHDII